MKKIRLLTLLVLGLLIGGTAYAQSRVSGVVKSSEDGQPLAGVVVQIKGTNVAVLTGADGAYTINNASVANATLVFNYAGMRKQEVPVAGKSTVNVTMQPDALQTEAVTVTALGGKKQDRKIGYATTTVKGDESRRSERVDLRDFGSDQRPRRYPAWCQIADQKQLSDLCDRRYRDRPRLWN